MDVQIDEAWDQHLAGSKLGQSTFGSELSGCLLSFVRTRLQHGADDAIPIDDDQRVRQRLDLAAFRRMQGGTEKSLVDDGLLAFAGSAGA